jgi:hypothetical protein
VVVVQVLQVMAQMLQAQLRVRVDLVVVVVGVVALFKAQVAQEFSIFSIRSRQ